MMVRALKLPLPVKLAMLAVVFIVTEIITERWWKRSDNQSCPVYTVFFADENRNENQISYSWVMIEMIVV